VIKQTLLQVGYAVLVLYGVVSLVFLLFIILPGDPAQMMVGQRSDEQTLTNIRNEYGFSEPVGVQYLMYLNDLSPIGIIVKNASGFAPTADRFEHYKTLLPLGKHTRLVLKFPYLRNSYQSKQSVNELLMNALPQTLILALVSIAIAAFFGIIMGLVAAYFKGTVFDKGLVSLTALGMSLPSFFAAILMGWIFAYLLESYTHLNLTGSLYEMNAITGAQHLALYNLILPALTLAIRPLSVFIQLTRNSLLHETTSDYFVTALAKGNSKIGAMRNHALKNALNPVITVISGWFASMLAGVVFVEYIFGWKGIGQLLVNALNNYDFPVVMGCILTIAFLFLLINMSVDVIYRWLDPRIRYQTLKK